MLYAIWFLVLYSGGAYCAYKSATYEFDEMLIVFSLILTAASIAITWPVLGGPVQDYLGVIIPSKGEVIHTLTVNVLSGIGCLACMALPLLAAYLLTKKSNQQGGLTSAQENVKAAE